MSKQTASFAAGCFWGVEARFRETPGVIDAVSGYMGGHIDNPTYKQVTGGDTGHYEAVEITYDPSVISYAQILDLFAKLNDDLGLDSLDAVDMLVALEDRLGVRLLHRFVDLVDACRRASGIADWTGTLGIGIPDAVTIWSQVFVTE